MPNAAIFVGLSTVDIVYQIDQFPAANSKVAAQSQSAFAGGPATNAAFACAHLGGKATLVTVVGRHPLSSVVREELKTHSVQLADLNPDFDGVPAISSISVDKAGNRNVVSANAASVPVPPVQVDSELCRRAHVLMVDGHFMQACQAWAAEAQACGTQVVLDGGSWKDGTEELLKCVRTAICSADFRPPGCATAGDALRFLKDSGVANIAITNGPEPIEALSGQSSATILVPQVDVIDTMGAGDILHGAYCYYASLGRDFMDALTQAASIASESCRYAGTREWMHRSLPSSDSDSSESRE